MEMGTWMEKKMEMDDKMKMTFHGMGMGNPKRGLRKNIKAN